MDTDHFHSLMGFAAPERTMLNIVMDGQGNREGLGGVKLPLASLKVKEEATPGEYLP